MDDVGESVVVATSLGQVRGVRESGVLHFRSMRYAEPPLGERRFLAPVASGQWAGTRDATRFPNRCTQPDNGLLGAPPGTPTSEDCLFLNRFDLPTTVDFLGQDVGATHGAEIPFTFNRFNGDDPGALVFYDRADPVVRDLSERWSDTIIAFARTGEPNGAGLPHWPRYDGASRQTLVLDGNPRVERDLNRDERELWEGVLGGREAPGVF